MKPIALYLDNSVSLSLHNVGLFQEVTVCLVSLVGPGKL